MGKSLEVEVALPSLLAHEAPGHSGGKGCGCPAQGSCQGQGRAAAELQLLGPGLPALSSATLPPRFRRLHRPQELRTCSEGAGSRSHLIPCLEENHILLGPCEAPLPSPQPPILPGGSESGRVCIPAVREQLVRRDAHSSFHRNHPALSPGQAGAVEELEAGDRGTTPRAVGACQLGPACSGIWQIC